MPAVKYVPDTEAGLRAQWTDMGLNERVRDDLMKLKDELVAIGIDEAEALEKVAEEVLNRLEWRILDRVRMTVEYNGDVQGGRASY